jgi:hypothetical protein
MGGSMLNELLRMSDEQEFWNSAVIESCDLE